MPRAKELERRQRELLDAPWSMPSRGDVLEQCQGRVGSRAEKRKNPDERSLAEGSNVTVWRPS